MLEIERKRYIFKTKEIRFADYPFDVKDCDRVIFYDCKNKINLPGFKCKEYTEFVIDLTQDLDVIWQDIDRKSSRYSIQCAIKEGIVIEISQNYYDFYKLNSSFREKKRLPNAENLDIYKKYGILFIAELNREVVAGQFYLKDNDNIRLIVAASKRLEVDHNKSILIGCGNRLIVWEAIKYAKEQGIKEFSLAGVYLGEKKMNPDYYNVAQFKKSFGGKLVTHYICQKDYSKIYTILSLLKQKLWHLKSQNTL